MVHYVRFLKTPRIAQGKDTTVSARITITTDLGESFLAAAVDLKSRLVDAKTGKDVVSKVGSWKPGCRDVEVSFDKFKLVKGQSLCVAVAVAPSSDHTPSDRRILIPPVLGALSAPFSATPGSVAKPLVQREFKPSDAQSIVIWEETGNSIALHIWDAAIGILESLHNDRTFCESRHGQLPCCIMGSLHRPGRILELGAGCGIVGITFATLFQSVDVTMTDLPEAMEIMHKNIERARPAHGSSLHHLVLDWDDEPPINISQDLDVVIVSDCTYNADALPSLIKVLVAIAKASPEILIMVATKRRHDSEAIFFELMDDSFRQTKIISRPLPHLITDYDVREPCVEMYYYKVK